MSKSTIEVDTRKDDDNRWVITARVNRDGSKFDENHHFWVAAHALLDKVRIEQ